MTASCCAQLFAVTISYECFNLFGHNHYNSTVSFWPVCFLKGWGLFKQCYLINTYLLSIESIYNIL